MLSLTRDLLADFESVSRREWLVTNGIGGFASGTLAGMNSRRYHGLLIASLKPPTDRVAMVAKIDAVALSRGLRVELATNEFGDGTVAPRGYVHLQSFQLDGQIPVWTWLIGDVLLEQRIWMAHGVNTTYVSYVLARGEEPIELELVPLCTYRDYHSQHRGYRDVYLESLGNGVRVHSFYGAHPYRVLSDDGVCTLAPEWYWNFKHRAETERGLDDVEDLFRPAVFKLSLLPGQMSTVVLTADDRTPLRAGESLARERARQQELLAQARHARTHKLHAATNDILEHRVTKLKSASNSYAVTPDWIDQLVLAADQFVVAREPASGGSRIQEIGDGHGPESSPTPSALLAQGRAVAAEHKDVRELPPQGEGQLRNRASAGATPSPWGEGNAAKRVGEDSSAAHSSATYAPSPVTRGAGATVIAGYPWFSDWGRDTMIALPGLTLSTGRFDVAASVLRTFAQFVSDGMLPNRFPDAGEVPEYNTVDATLWFFVAIDEYLRACDDRYLLDDLYPVLTSILRWHERGTRYGIHVDPKDGLLHAGEPGSQLTWMDARVGERAITPRIGKPVEINALWFNALTIMRDLAARLKDGNAWRQYASAAERVARSFNERFWFAPGAHLFDVVDSPEGDDASLRPNQIFAVSLHHTLLDNTRAKAIVDACARELWTPVGLRSLAKVRSPTAADRRLATSQSAAMITDAACSGTWPIVSGQPAIADARYSGRYTGGPRERDAVYHQGTVWSWLLGPFAAAHYRIYHDATQARRYLEGMQGHLHEACIGQISEIFDGDAPFTARGCFAQAWGVAEILRVWGELDDGAAFEDRRKTQQHTAPVRK